MVFGMAVDCDGCGGGTTCISVAQYMNGESQQRYICQTCYAHGFRCWLHEDGKLSVSYDQPPGTTQAQLYWDEGNYVTGGGLEITYPNTTQPKGTR